VEKTGVAIVVLAAVPSLEVLASIAKPAVDDTVVKFTPETLLPFTVAF